MRSLLLLVGISSSVYSKDPAICTTAKIKVDPIIVGHRGASGYEPENTLRSFKRAIDMGVSMIELDVYLCKSGEVVVIHDDTIDRTTNGTGIVGQLTWDTLQQFNAGKGEHIPLLSQVFDLVDQKVVINIEIKDPHATMPVADLIEQYVAAKHWSYNQFIISSFDHAVVQEFHFYCPRVKTGALFDVDSQDEVEITKRLHADYVIVDYQSVTAQLINAAHGCGLQVFTYTVNDKSLALRLKELDIDGIITNYPDILS